MAKTQFGEGEMESRQWAEAVLSLLSFSEMDDVLSILWEIEPRKEEAEEKIRKLTGYLEKNRDHIHYETDR